MSYTELLEKVFTFSLPDNSKGGCKELKDEEKFIDNICKIEGFRQIEGVNICGLYAIHIDANCSMSDNEIINTIDTIVNDIGFRR